MTTTPLTTIPSTFKAAEFARAAAACGGTLAVRPIVAGDNWMEPAEIVGRAASYDEALQLITDAGYEVIPADNGGCHEPDPQDESDEYLVTVRPQADNDVDLWSILQGIDSSEYAEQTLADPEQIEAYAENGMGVTITRQQAELIGRVGRAWRQDRELGDGEWSRMRDEARRALEESREYE